MSLKNLGLNDRQINALDYMARENKSLTVKEYVDLTNVSRPTAFRDLNKFVELGLLESKYMGSFKEYSIIVY
ncbi:MAG: MarR family transcriptional regulator [Methanobrevibacter sp.]|nr:MarR family transcriptional regulator [Candidatus Methanovirga procula]